MQTTTSARTVNVFVYATDEQLHHHMQRLAELIVADPVARIIRIRALRRCADELIRRHDEQIQDQRRQDRIAYSEQDAPLDEYHYDDDPDTAEPENYRAIREQ